LHQKTVALLPDLGYNTVVVCPVPTWVNGYRDLPDRRGEYNGATNPVRSAYRAMCKEGVVLMDKPKIRAKYDKCAPDYGCDKSDLIYNALLENRWRRKLLERASGDVLEIAIGTGLNYAFYPQGCRLTGIDLSEVMLERVRKQADSLKLKSALCVMDVEQLGFVDDSFDTVVDTLSLCTFPNPVLALHEMARVCRDGGRILLFEHGRCSWGWLARYQDRKAEEHASSLGCQWNRDHIALVQQAELPIVTVERKLFGFYYIIEAAPPAKSQVQADD
jgi:ubiquinone/menaquinone biosynthesis C-methylase UbiE